VVFVGNVGAQDFFSSIVNFTANGTFTVFWNNTPPTADTIQLKWGDTNPPVDSQYSWAGSGAPNFFQINNNANVKPYYFQIVKVIGNNTQYFIPYATIFLQVTPRNSDIFGVNAIAELKWNPVQPDLPGEFFIFRSGVSGSDNFSIPYKHGET